MTRITPLELDIPPVSSEDAPAAWLETLERSEAQIAAGQTVPLEPVLDIMRASIARMEAKRAKAGNT